MAGRMTSGSNCRRLNRAETEGARSILPAYQVIPPNLQHFRDLRFKLSYRDLAKAFFCKAFRRHGDPRVITLDGFEPTHAALRRMGMK